MLKGTRSGLSVFLFSAQRGVSFILFSSLLFSSLLFSSLLFSSLLFSSLLFSSLLFFNPPMGVNPRSDFMVKVVGLVRNKAKKGIARKRKKKPPLGSKIGPVGAIKRLNSWLILVSYYLAASSKALIWFLHPP